MTFLLKVVQGANAGAEIALPEGTTVSLGRGDACDIVLNDAALAEKACELEVTSERVAVLYPGGKQVRLEAFHVHFVGTTALVVGPETGAWKPLIWPEAHPVMEDTEAKTETPAKGTTKSVTEKKTEETSKRRRGVWVILVLLLLLLLVGGWFLLAWLAKKDSERGCGQLHTTIVKMFGSESEEVLAESLPPPETLEDIVAEYQLEQQATAAGGVRLIGNFASRAERLNATARVYRVHPGAELDFCDGESLAVAVENLLALVTEGRMRLKSLDGRTVFLEGKVASEADLRRVLEALSADVPKVERADCSAVTQGLVADPTEDEMGPAQVVAAHHQDAPTQPAMPVVGILTVPYPCLVLQDGSRVMEGARLGGYTIETIASDRVVLTCAEGSFTWRP